MMAAGTQGAKIIPLHDNPARLPIGSAVLVVTPAPTPDRSSLLERSVISIGRHPGSDIFLDDVTADRPHAEFRSENGGFRTVDTGSLKGISVNRKPVRPAVLANGDEIQLGKFHLVFMTPARRRGRKLEVGPTDRHVSVM